VALIAHIGNVPVEESLPFLVPIVALYLYGRHWHRRRQQALGRLPSAGEPLDDRTFELVAAEWAKADHGEVSREQLPLLYPPGPDGATVGELAARLRSDLETVQRLLDDLQELGYLDLEERAPRAGRRAWLTDHGYDLVQVTEDALVDSLSPRSRAAAGR
jgi:MarR family